jgi:thiol-disulfide isomerase/thioredoxin
MATDSEVSVTERKKQTLASVLVPVAVILAGVLFALSYLRAKTTTHDGAEHGAIVRKIGEPIPDLTFHTIEGKTVKLSELKAKVVLINFWATWCTPCVRELPSLQKLSDQYASQGLLVLGVNVDEDPESVLGAFLAKNQIKFQSFIDPKGELSDRFNVSGLPLTIVLDRDRKLLMEHLGDEEWFDSDYRKQFELWLTGKSSG